MVLSTALVAYCCVTNYSESSSWKEYTFVIIISVGQEFGYGLAGSSVSGSLTRLHSTYQPGLEADMKVPLWKDPLSTSVIWLLAE